MGIPQIGWIVLVSVSLMLAANHHGKYSVWPSVIAAAIEVVLLIWGGFFS